MAVTINDRCVSCHACSDQCPNDAIYKAETHFMINPKKCTECEGDHAKPQCSEVCPIEAAIVDSTGAPFYPLGTLTMIPVEKIKEFEQAGYI